MIEWWGNRAESDQAYKVKVEDLKDWDLDIKNPTVQQQDEILPTSEIVKKLKASFSKSEKLVNDLESLLN